MTLSPEKKLPTLVGINVNTQYKVKNDKGFDKKLD